MNGAFKAPFRERAPCSASTQADRTPPSPIQGEFSMRKFIALAAAAATALPALAVVSAPSKAAAQSYRAG